MVGSANVTGSPEDACVLCSLAGRLRISEIIDGGRYIVSALLPESLISR